jgi:hypothetical protein
MSQTAPGTSLLAADGAAVTDREVWEGVVERVFPGDGWFFEAKITHSAEPGAPMLDELDGTLVPAADAPLIVAGARFWYVVESVDLPTGRRQRRAGIRVRRDEDGPYPAGSTAWIAWARAAWL